MLYIGRGGAGGPIYDTVFTLTCNTTADNLAPKIDHFLFAFILKFKMSYCRSYFRSSEPFTNIVIEKQNPYKHTVLKQVEGIFLILGDLLVSCH